MQAVSELALGLDPALQASLAAQFPTVQDFVTRRPQEHAPTDRHGSQEQQALDALLAYVREHVAPPVRSGAAVLAGLRATRLLPIGCACLDRGLLGGGLREGTLLEAAGECGSGKSQLCMQAAANTAMRGERVIFVDTEGSFQARRFGRMHEALAAAGGGADAAARADVTELVAALECVELFRVYDLPGLLQLLRALHAKLQEEERARRQQGAAQPPPRVSLLVLDSASFVGAAAFGAGPPGGVDPGGGQALLVAMGAALKSLAQRFSIAVLATNHLVGGVEDARPALGEAWKTQASTRIALSCQGGRLRHAVLSASSLRPRGACAWFELTAGGLQPAAG